MHLAILTLKFSHAIGEPAMVHFDTTTQQVEIYGPIEATDLATLARVVAAIREDPHYQRSEADREQVAK